MKVKSIKSNKTLIILIKIESKYAAGVDNMKNNVVVGGGIRD